jgi:hypothetical protein
LAKDVCLVEYTAPKLLPAIWKKVNHSAGKSRDELLVREVRMLPALRLDARNW